MTKYNRYYKFRIVRTRVSIAFFERRGYYVPRVARHIFVFVPAEGGLFKSNILHKKRADEKSCDIGAFFYSWADSLSNNTLHLEIGWNFTKRCKKNEKSFGSRLYVCLYVSKRCPGCNFWTLWRISLNFGYVIDTGEISRRVEKQILRWDSGGVTRFSDL